MPDVRAASELVPGYEAASWFGIGAPKRTAADIIVKLNTAVNAGLETPRIKAQLAELGASAIPGSPAQFGRFIVQETEKYAGVIRTAKIKAE